MTAGLPSVDTTIALLQRLDAAGCHAIEVGFPFSDSIADGPVIQDSFCRALDGGFRVDDLFGAVKRARSSISAGLIAMVSMSLVRRAGLDRFVVRAAESGFDGLIVPDVPVNECGALSDAAAAAGLCNILMAAPTTPPSRRELIARHSTGFVYLIAAMGVTGERAELADNLTQDIQAMRRLCDVPIIAGFGITTADQVRQVCTEADGVIVGSAIIRRILEALDSGASQDALVESVGQFVDELVVGTRTS